MNKSRSTPEGAGGPAEATRTRNRRGDHGSRREGPGRRPGTSTSREEILDAARTRFARQGYDGTTVREVAADAGVDAALVHYFFGPKTSLFAAAMALPVNPADVLAGLLAGGVQDLGDRLARTVPAVWDDPETGGPLVALVRSAAGNEDAATMLREFAGREVLGQMADALDDPQAELRAALVVSQILGFAMVRHVLRVEPLASADHETLANALGPTLQRYLTGELSAPD
jgi:AcrR family transcriptional regulator